MAMALRKKKTLMHKIMSSGFLKNAVGITELFGAQLFHYQDYANREIDAVIELKDGRWCAFEIKLGAHQIDKAAENLIKIRDKIASEGGKVPSEMCVVCGMSNAAYKRKDGIYVVPITALKD